MRVHPLFLAMGALSAFFGTLPIFLAAVLAALEHECAHAYVAARYGYTLDKVVLMPYGAVISGDLTGIGRKAELAVLAAGPLCNLLTGVFFVALWWLYPETYPYTELAASVSFSLFFVALWWLYPETYAYTDVAAAVSFSLFFVNLLPAYPLDGGRILRVFLRPLGEKRARIAGMVGTFTVAAAVLGYFIWSCFSAPNVSALLFSLLLFCGAFGGGDYGRIVFSPKRFQAGVEERRIALSGEVKARDAIRFLREDRYLTLLVFDGETFSGEIAEEEFLRALSGGGYDLPLSSLVA